MSSLKGNLYIIISQRKPLQYHRLKMTRGLDGSSMQKKENLNCLKLSLKKVAMTYSPTNLCCAIGPR